MTIFAEVYKSKCNRSAFGGEIFIPNVTRTTDRLQVTGIRSVETPILPDSPENVRLCDSTNRQAFSLVL